MTEEKIKQTSIRLPADVHRRLRIACAETGMSMHELLISCIYNFLDEHEAKKAKEK